MKYFIISLILMSWLGTGFAQSKDSAIRDSGAPKATQPAKTAPETKNPAIKQDTNKLKKSDTTLKKDTVKKAASQPDSTNRQQAARKKADTAAVANENQGNGNKRQNHSDSAKQAVASSGNSTGSNSNTNAGKSQSEPPTPVEKPNPLPLKMAAAAIAKGNAALDLSTYFPKNMNGMLSGDQSLGIVQLHAQQNRDYLFYSFLGITLFLALIKISFPKYFNQIFWFFLHPNDRKKNFSEQINGQHIIPSILLNLFFALTGGLFLTQIFHPVWTGGNFWKNWIIFALVLVVVYLVKFLIINLSGWLFNSPIAAGTYNNVVFSINKIIGVILLPITLLIAYGGPESIRSAISAATIVISILLIYRYIASFLLIKGKLRVNAFHFILYLCAVEIIPLLLAYKVLFSNIDQLI